MVEYGCKDMNDAVQNHFELFKNDFYISNDIPEDADMVIYLNDKDKYIIFKDNDIAKTINDKIVEMFKQKD